jgi:hypothetical protein
MNIKQAQLFVILVYTLCNFYYMKTFNSIAPYRYVTRNGWTYYTA